MDNFDKLAALFESEDGDLFKPAPKKHIITKDERLASKFEEINEFVRKNSRIPDKNSTDMTEMVLGASLESIRTKKEQVEALSEYDEFGLLEIEKAPESLEELFAEDSGLFKNTGDIFDVSKLPNNGQKRVVENSWVAAEREKCADFDKTYRRLFEERQKLLSLHKNKLVKFTTISQLKSDNFYIHDGQMCYVAEFGKIERKAGGYSQQRLLVIFENGTQSNMYRRSLAQRLYEDSGYCVVESDFDEENDNLDSVGHIYVLRSLSKNGDVQDIANLYKIGMTKGSVKDRIANAKNDPTYLMAPVEIVETYKLTGSYNTQKVEAMIHRFLSDAKVSLSIFDKNGREYIPEEWYSVPISVVRETIDLMNNGEIINYIYDGEKQRIVGLQDK